MRVLMIALVGAALSATVSMPAFAHHNTSHSIVVQSADRPQASGSQRETAQRNAIQFATGQRGAPAVPNHRCAHKTPCHHMSAQASPQR